MHERHYCHYVVLAHSAGVTECQPLNHEHNLYLPLRKTPEDTFRNTGKRPTQGRGVGYEKKNHDSHFLRTEDTYIRSHIQVGLYTHVVYIQHLLSTLRGIDDVPL